MLSFSPVLFAPATAADIGLQAWTNGPRPSAFTLKDTGGHPLALSAQRTPIVLVHFFATWCEPCREEFPALHRLVQRGGGAVTVLAISVAEVESRVLRFLKTTPVTFPVLLDPDRTTAKAWKVTTLPTTFVLDGKGHLRLFVESDFAWDGIEPAQLKNQLASAGAPRAVADGSAQSQ